MANIGFRSNRLYSDHAMACLASVDVNIGATGAVTSVANKSKISAVTRLSTGLYRLALVAPFASIYSSACAAVSPSSGTSGVLGFELANAQATTVASVSAPFVDIKCLDAAGALADPASGSQLKFQLMLSNSSLAG